jgi:hypothetical protein
VSRTLSFIAVLAGCTALIQPLGAQEQPPDTGDPRFAFHRSDDGGYLRLDLGTGEVAACSQRDGDWACALVPDDRVALDSEIVRLRRENAILKNALLARGVPLPGGVTAATAPPLSEIPVPPAASRPPVPPQTVPPAPRPPKTGESDRASREDAEIDRIMNVMEKVWRRLVDMMINIQRDIQKKS